METRGKGMIKIEKVCVFVIGFFFLLFLVSGQAQEKKGPRKSDDKRSKAAAPFGLSDKRGPINIDSDTAEGNQKQNTVTFKGNVIAKQDDSTLYAGTLVVYYDPDTKRIKEIVATGQVKIVQAERRATSQKVTFYQDENKVVLDGEAVIREGENVIRGERVTYYVDEERSVVEGGKGSRVNTTITPPKKE